MQQRVTRSLQNKLKLMPISPPNIVGTLQYKGVWNATTNTPTLTSSVGTQGFFYVVGVAGTTNLNGIAVWDLGDWAVFNGSVWGKVDSGSGEVLSVAGKVGVVTLEIADISGAVIGTDLQAYSFALDSWATIIPNSTVLNATASSPDISGGLLSYDGSGLFSGSAGNVAFAVSAGSASSATTATSAGNASSADSPSNSSNFGGIDLTALLGPGSDGASLTFSSKTNLVSAIFTSDSSHFVDGTGAYQLISSISATQKLVTNATPTTGQTVSAAGVHQDELIYIQPSGTLLALTVQLEPGGGVVADIGDTKELFISQIITGLTVSASGGTVRGTALTTSSAINGSYEYIKVTSTDWLRIR